MRLSKLKQKRHGTEQIIRKLREVETLEGQGQTIAQACRKLEINEKTLHRRLRKAVADLVLDSQIIEEVLKGKD